MSYSKFRHFFGGAPGPVLVRLAILSLVVGIVLNALNLHPMHLVTQFFDLIERLYHMGFDAIGWAIDYFVLGALVVFPIWFVSRLLKISRKDTE